MLCALAAQLGWTIRGCDLTQAYLQGTWPANLEKVYGHQKYHDGVEYVCEVGNVLPRSRQCTRSFAEAQP
eukprot:3021632-Prymnesium_polylepis.1